MFCKNKKIKETELVIYKKNKKTIFSNSNIHKITVLPTKIEKQLFSIYQKQSSHNVTIIPYIIPNNVKIYPNIKLDKLFFSVTQSCSREIRSYKNILENNTTLNKCQRKELINRIKKTYYLFNYFIDNWKKLSNKIILKTTCPICLCSICNNNKAFTLCCHIYCFTCIVQELQHRKSCPICRRYLVNRYIFRYNGKESNTVLQKYGSKIKYLYSLLNFWKKNNIHKNVIVFCLQKKIKKLVSRILRKSDHIVHISTTDIQQFDKANINNHHIYLIDSTNFLETNINRFSNYPIILLDEILPTEINTSKTNI